jgi:hypothetical protein
MADSLNVSVGFDRWMYPFNASAGTRVSATTFGAVQNPAFDDLDAQILLGFDTASAGVPTAAGGGLYRITQATVRLTTATDGAFELDNTYDAFGTYLEEATDSDAGRPLELYGVGFRNGYASAGFGGTVAGPPVFEEAEGFGIPGPPAPQRRHAFASDYAGGQPRDVSNSVREGFDPVPWAIGDVPGLATGSSVPLDTAVVFQIDVHNPDVLAQLQAGLDAGGLFFAVGSRHRSTQGSSEGIPSFHFGGTDGVSIGPRASLQLDYEIVPEPSAAALFGLGVCLVSRSVRRRN